MNEQFELFKPDCYIEPKLANLRNSIKLGWAPFSVDKLQKASRMYGVLCETVWNTYEQVIVNEQPSYNSEGEKRSEASEC
jgi:hypothetical protein